MVIMDTHAWVWWVNQDKDRFPVHLYHYLESEVMVISVISIYEVSILVERGRVGLTLPLNQWILEALEGSGIDVVPVSRKIAEKAGVLPDIHGDPMDRILIATAQVFGLSLISKDRKIEQYPDLQTIWE